MKPEILFVHPLRSSFVDRDIEILREKYTVEVLLYDRREDLAALLLGLSRSRLAFAWFALGYAYPIVRVGRALGRGAVLVAGGYDVEALSELNYGAMLSERRRRRTAFALGHADRVLAVSQFTQKKVQAWAPTSAVEVVYHGFPVPVFDETAPRVDRILTVANVGRHTWRVKGLDLFMEAARAMPSVSFAVAGPIEVNPREFVEDIPPNVRFLGQVAYRELFELYRSSKVYAQLSRVESFGCALAEAMSCGCYPVVADVGALPEVVGDTGRRVNHGDREGIVSALQAGLIQGSSTAAAMRVRQLFPLERRRKRLHAVVDEILANGPDGRMSRHV